MARTNGDYERMPHRMEVRFEPDDNVWVVSFPELPGCDAHGATPAEAIEAGAAAKRLWIETALEEGDRIPEPQLQEEEYSGRLLLRMPKTLHRKVATTAAEEDVSLNQFLVATIAERVGMKTAQKALSQRVCGMTGSNTYTITESQLGGGGWLDLTDFMGSNSLVIGKSVRLRSEE